MEKLYVTTKYKLPPQDLLQKERKIKDSFLQHLMTVRVIMKEHTATSAAQIIDICCQFALIYVQMF